MALLLSISNIILAALINTAMVGFGLHGRRVDPNDPARRRPRWLWVVAGLGSGFFTLYVANEELRFSGGSAQFLTFVTLFFVGLLLAFLLIRKGLKGRLVGDHPHCRKCGFDLFGKPDGVMICSECGSDLRVPAATVIGIRQRRMPILLAGVFSLMMSLPIGVGVVKAARGNSGFVNINQYKPTWLLMRQTQTPSRWGYSENEQELARRAQMSDLDAETIRALIKRHLDDNDPLKWRTASFGVPLVLRSWMDGTLPDTECEALLDRLNQVTVIPVSATPDILIFEAFNQGEQNRFTASPAASTLVEVRAGGIVIVTAREPSLSPGARFGNAVEYTLRFAEPRALGPLTLELAWDLKVTYTATGKTPIVINKRVITPLPMQIVPASQLAAMPIEEPGWEVGYQATVEVGANSTTLAFVNRSRTPFLGEAILVDSQTGKQIPLGLIYLSEYGNDGQLVTTLPIPADGFEIELVPRPELGERLGRAVETYQKPVRIKPEQITVVDARPPGK